MYFPNCTKKLEKEKTMIVNKRDILNFMEEVLLAPERAETITKHNSRDGSRLVVVLHKTIEEHFPELNVEKWEVKAAIR